MANQLAGHIDLIDLAVRLQSVRPVGPTGLTDQTDVAWVGVGPTIGTCKRFIRLVGQTSRTDRSVRRSYRVNAQLDAQSTKSLSLSRVDALKAATVTMPCRGIQLVLQRRRLNDLLILIYSNCLPIAYRFRDKG